MLVMQLFRSVHTFASFLLISDAEGVTGHCGAVEVQQRLRGGQGRGAEDHVAQPCGCKLLQI